MLVFFPKKIMSRSLTFTKFNIDSPPKGNDAGEMLQRFEEVRVAARRQNSILRKPLYSDFDDRVFRSSSSSNVREPSETRSQRASSCSIIENRGSSRGWNLEISVRADKIGFVFLKLADMNGEPLHTGNETKESVSRVNCKVTLKAEKCSTDLLKPGKTKVKSGANMSETDLAVWVRRAAE